MGQSKAWLPFGDELMLPRVVRLLSQAVSPIVVVAAVGQGLPPLPAGIIVAHDPLPDRGPLQGMAAGLQALDGPQGTDAAYVSGCDVPFLRPAFVRRMIELLGDSQACVPNVGGHLHPLAAVYRQEVRAAAESQLREGRFSLVRFCSRLRIRRVAAVELAPVDPEFRSLENINTPEDYAAALKSIGGPIPSCGPL
jgi:molybdopterin-guanine dinucleotide biosynthesis protein A